MMKKREFLKELNSLRETSNLFIDVSQDIERLLQDCKLQIEGKSQKGGDKDGSTCVFSTKW